MLEPGTEEERQEASSIRYVVGVRLALLSTGAIAIYDGVELQGVLPAQAAASQGVFLAIRDALFRERDKREHNWRAYERKMMELRTEPASGPQSAKISIEDAGGL